MRRQRLHTWHFTFPRPRLLSIPCLPPSILPAVREAMITIRELNDFISNPELTDSIAQVWALIGKHFEEAQSTLPAERAMPRKELSFHDHVRLLGYLALLVEGVPGDVV